MSLSRFVLELLELSGMSDNDFCNKVGLSIDELNNIKSGTEENVLIGTLVKAFGTSIFKGSNKKRDEFCAKERDDALNQLTQAQAIVLTVGESQGLEDHQEISLSVATELIDKARTKI